MSHEFIIYFLTTLQESNLLQKKSVICPLIFIDCLFTRCTYLQVIYSTFKTVASELIND